MKSSILILLLLAGLAVKAEPLDRRYIARPYVAEAAVAEAEVADSAREDSARREAEIAEAAKAEAARAEAARVAAELAKAEAAAAEVAASMRAEAARAIVHAAFGARYYAGWREVREAVPSMLAAAPMPEWRNPEVIALESVAEVGNVLQRITGIRQEGRTVLVAWSPRRHTTPEAPEVAAAIARIAAAADGFLIAYHRSGAHFAIPSPGELDHLARAARSGNPRIALFGEAYFGELDSSLHRDLSVIAPAGCSGVVLWNAVRSNVVTLGVAAEVKARTGLPVVLAIPHIFKNRFPEYPHRLVFHFDPQNN